MWRTEGDALGPASSWTPPTHHSTCTGSGGPTAEQLRLKGTPGRVETSWGSWTKWGTPGWGKGEKENRMMKKDRGEKERRTRARESG